jgi:hypothetical protein
MPDGTAYAQSRSGALRHASRFLRVKKEEGMIDLQPAFIPFMVGSISLTAYSSLRNFYLARATRVLSKELIDTLDPLIKQSLVVQLEWFVRRYKVSNNSLLLAISSVFLFGLMIAAGLGASSGWAQPWFRIAANSLLLAGGIAATLATLLSLYEAFVARRSLFTAVAVCVAKAAPFGSGLDVTSEIGEIAKGVRGSVRPEIYDMVSSVSGGCKEGSAASERKLRIRGEGSA